MRVVVLTDDYPPQRGGVSTWTAAAVEALSQRHDVEVFARARGDRAPDAAVNEVRGRSFRAWGGLWLARAAWSDLRRADLILATTWSVATAVAPLARRWKRPLHTVFHGSDLTCLANETRFRRVVKGAHCWAVSEFLVAEAKRLGVQASWLPCPLPTETPVAGGERWVMVARAVRSKAGERFVRLVAAADRHGDVVGDGPELRRWKALAEQLGARIRFHGALGPEGVHQVLQDAALAVLLPRADGDFGAEGLGLALLEARLRGLPVVGCRTGGVPEAVGPGLLLNHPDDPVASVAAIDAWYSPERGSAGREAYRKRHGPEAFVRALTCPRHS